MVLAVLQDRQQIDAARLEMKRRGVSCATPAWLMRWLRILRLERLGHGDIVKSWDVWKTARFIEDNVARTDPIVDLGAYQSEILPVLHCLGYQRLAGVDLNPHLARAPYHGIIDYRVADFCRSPFDSSSFQVVTAISTIEHGYDPQRLWPEVARLLRPGGYFLGSMDYWPDKVDTSGLKIFDLSWTVFSCAELRALLEAASGFGLSPVGDLDFAAPRPVLAHMGRHYTFAWLALRKA